MSWLFEDPTAMIVVAVLVEAALGAAFVAKVRRELLWAMGAVLLALIAGLTIEWYVVTDREQVEATLDGGVAALEANDKARVLTYLSPSAVKTRARAQWALDLVEFQTIRLSSLEIKVNKLTDPPTAEARFDAFFQFHDRTGQIPYRSYALKFKVELEQIDGRWLITDHTEYEAYQP